MSKKTVLLTGASSGIGKATAIKLIREGYTVYCAARRVERMNDLQQIGGIPIGIDITKEADMAGAIEKINQEQGAVDILINNAGFGVFGAFEDVSIEIARAQYEVNVFGLARMAQLVLPRMRAQKSGKIVNISSIGGKFVTPMSGWYQSTKFAVEALSDALRMEVQRFGIDVIIIEPGIVASEFEDIAGDNLMKTSGEGAYKAEAQKMVEAFERSYQGASPPTVIADVISQALKANKPKTRYAAGAQAKSTLFVKWLLPDRMFDNLAMGQTIK